VLTLSIRDLQRLDITSAMAIDPKILYLDEPTSLIDGENTGMVEEVILSLK
jgi:ABC-type phosphate transport system ATPase subunit